MDASIQCVVVLTLRKVGEGIKGYVVGEVDERWTIFLIRNELVLLENLRYREFVVGKKIRGWY